MAPPIQMDHVDPSIGQGRRASWPAWLLSVAVHAVAIVVLGLMLRNVARSQSVEPSRAVSIVLAQSNGGDDVEFLTEEEEFDTRGESAQQDATAASEEQATEAALPKGDPADANQLFPDLALPGGAVLGGGDDDLLKSPSLKVTPSTRILPGQGDAEILAAEALRRRPTGPSGPPTKVSLFGSAPARGHSFVFILDRSKSMGGSGLGALEAAEKELAAAVAPLEGNHSFDIIAYHNRPVYFSRKYFKTSKLVPATAENKARLPDFFGGLAPFGYTEHEMALKAGLYMKPDVIYFLTDGGEPPLSDVQIRRLKRLAAGRTTIHCIQFGSGRKQEESFMERLSLQTSGGYGYVDMSKR